MDDSKVVEMAEFARNSKLTDPRGMVRLAEQHGILDSGRKAVLLVLDDSGSAYDIQWCAASMTPAEAVALLEVAKARFIESLL